MTLKQLFFISLFFWANTTFAQTIVEGKISDMETQKGLGETLIFLENDGSSYTSDAKGKFVLDFSKKNFEVYHLAFLQEGYYSKKISVKASDKQKIRIQLKTISADIGSVKIIGKKKTQFGYTRIKSIEGTTIYSSKKAEIVDLATINANVANNSSRQIFSKVSGLNIWESDCSGLQLGVGSRGLSPSRTANFNVRQNGYDISADAIGYPDAYYAPPMQALQSIELVKGAASLQYGTQFGGLINFKLKEAPTDKKIEWNSSLTGGSYKYLNTFNSLGGTIDKLSYYTFYQYRRGDCWRCNSTFNYHSGYAGVKYQASEKLSFKLEYSGLWYTARQAGGLTDFLFNQDAQQSIRYRNWFKIFWNLLNLKMKYDVSPNTKIEAFVLAQHAGRDASGFLGRISRTDPLNETDLLKDVYNNLIFEGKVLQKYKLFGLRMASLVGTRYMQGITTKQQGATHNDTTATFQFVTPNRLNGSDFDFFSRNFALFNENVFKITPKLSVTIGARLEYLNQKAIGYYSLQNKDLAGNILLDTLINEHKSFTRVFPFFGGGISYKFNPNLELYSNFSQNYRAVGFNDLRVINPSLVVDSNIQDERGFNFDLGIKGSAKNDLIFFDGNFFLLRYSNRIGTYLTTVPDPIILQRIVRFRTNISSALSYGFEFFAQADIYRLLAKKKENAPISLSVYLNMAWVNATYTDSKQVAFYKKKIEDVPPLTLKTGLDFQWKKLRMGTQFSYTHQHYSDATNTEFSPDAIAGIIPSYYTLDFNASYSWKMLSLKLALNNITNNIYFTRRATGYPGPGVLPSDPFNFNITLGVKL